MIHDDIKLQRKPGHLERAHVNFTVVADSGIGKSPAMQPLIEPIRKIEARFRSENEIKLNTYNVLKELHEKRRKETLRAHNDTAAALNLAETDPPPVRPAARQIIAEAATVESMEHLFRDNHGGVLNHQDEISGWIAGFDAYRKGGGDQSFWTLTDNGGERTRNRVAEGGSFHMPNVSCCFIGGIQPDALAPLARKLATDGFLQRTFPVYGQRSARGEQYQDVNIAAKAAYEQLIEALAKIEPATPIIYDWDADIVRRRIEAVAEALSILPTTRAHLKQHLNKWRGKVTRLVLLFHVIECVARGAPVAGIVDRETVERVERFMLRFILPNGMRFYNEFFRLASDKDAEVEWFAGHILARKVEHVTLRDLLKAVHWEAAEKHRVMSAMGTLELAGWVSEPITGKRGSTIWRVNPAVHLHYSERAAEERRRREAIHEAIKQACTVAKQAGVG